MVVALSITHCPFCVNRRFIWTLYISLRLQVVWIALCTIQCSICCVQQIIRRDNSHAICTDFAPVTKRSGSVREADRVRFIVYMLFVINHEMHFVLSKKSFIIHLLLVYSSFIFISEWRWQHSCNESVEPARATRDRDSWCFTLIYMIFQLRFDTHSVLMAIFKVNLS